MMKFDVTVNYMEGKFHYAADALSRRPRFNFMTADEDFMTEAYTTRRTFTEEHGYARKDPKLVLLFEAAREASYQQVVEAVKSGCCPSALDRDHTARDYREQWDTLSMIDELPDPLLVMDNNRLVVPIRARKLLLKKLHIPHTGAGKTIETTKSVYFWPAMKRNIEQMCKGCGACRETGARRPHEPQLADNGTPITRSAPMREVGADLFEV